MSWINEFNNQREQTQYDTDILNYPEFPSVVKGGEDATSNKR